MTATGPATVPSSVDPAILHALGEHLAAGYFEDPTAAPGARIARGMRRHLEAAELPPAVSGPLFPCGSFSLWDQGAAVRFHYSHALVFDANRLQALRAQHPQAGATLDALAAALSSYPAVGASIPPAYRLGGAGYTHSIPNFGRVCREGLERYAARIATHLDEARAAGATEAIALYEGLTDVLAGIECWHRRCLQHLAPAGAAISGAAATAGCVFSALRRVPWKPASTFYEALVATNFVYYLDGCDSLGRFDQDLGPYCEHDLNDGSLNADTATAWVRQLWENVDANSGWNVALGGSTSDGRPADNALTRICLRAAHGIRRPNLALRLRSDTPVDVYDAALDAIASGCGIPALYGEESYLAALRGAHLNIHPRDLADFAFGGCTETMVHGKSNVGSLDAGINLLSVLTDTLRRRLGTAVDFEALLTGYKEDLRQAIGVLVAGVNRDQELKAKYQPQPMRSLLIDDCIEAGVEYNAGGARYNWSVINVGGLANVVDSLAAVRQLVFDEASVDRGVLWAALEADFSGYEPLRQRLSQCPRFGNDDPAADELAAELSAFVFVELRQYAPWRGGRFLPGCLMFVTYAGAGQDLMATPDGRRAGTPVADSAGPYQGRDQQGPTAMMRSVTRLAQHLAPGTLVVNARFAHSTLVQASQRQRLLELIRTYFSLGGLQLQINVVDQETLAAACRAPDEYRDLIVRVGGYSEYFHRLSPELQQSLLERTEHV